MKIAILGYDLEGHSSYDYFLALGHELVIHDQKTDLQLPSGAASVLGEGYLDNLDEYDLLVRTAGLPPKLILEKNPKVQHKITSQLNEFLRVCPTRNIIGVTGTKGKGTTSTLIAKMLEASGKSVRLAGNIGVPPLTFVHELDSEDWVVLELSSFQLIDVQYSPHIGVCLMVVPEHLNWHTDMAEYMQAKSQMFVHQTAIDTAIYYAAEKTSTEIASHGHGKKIPYYQQPGAYIDGESIMIDGQEICQINAVKLPGQHNLQNICAAITAVWQTDAANQDTAAIRAVLSSFTGLPHRLEFIRELHGVKYYDDSFGTTPETAVVAIEAFEDPKIIILGGSDKGADYGQLAEAVAKDDVRQVVLIGEQADRIQAALEKVGFTNFVPGGDTMTDIVATSAKHARSGDIVLLSPGCASFDMFENYKDRAEKFIEAVQALA